MTSLELEYLQERIEEAKEQKAKAEGRIEGIIAGWEKDHGVSTPEEVKVLIAKLEDEMAEIDTKRTILSKKIREALLEIEG